VYSSVLSAPATGVRDGRDANIVRFVRVSLLVLFTYVFLANAWIGDDAHITFRSVWNFVHGYGLSYNPDERVQAYTHPLWMLTLSAAHFFTREFFFTVTALSYIFSVIAGVVVLRRTTTLGSAALTTVWLLSSKALIDYTASGLEYPLSYLLIALFYVNYFERRFDVPTPRELRFFTVIAALAFVNRADTALLFVPPLAEMTLWSLIARGRQTFRPLIIGALPAVLWLSFATFYYGFPLPNTYYAKVANGIPSWLQHQQGWAYLFNSISHDPITLGTIALCVLFAVRVPGAMRRAAISAFLYVAYTVSIGGDFMGGRFFAMPFLVAVIAMVPDVDRQLVPWLGGALILYNLVVPIVPIKTTATYDAAWPWRNQNGIKDERGHNHQGSNLLKFAPFLNMPNGDLAYGREGLSAGASTQHASLSCCIGLYGLNAGPTKHVIDENALADPLLARLPISPRVYFDFWASHYFRDLPEGYVESNERDQNLLTDPLLHTYYEKLRNVTRGSVWRLSRLRDIWALNVEYRNLKDRYEKRRPIVLSFQANHPRFQTEAGFRDDRAGVIRTTGKGGYLQYGPNIPLPAQFYRVRWVGVVDDLPGTHLGFVEVWNGDQRLDRQPVVCANGRSDHKLAELDFQLKEPARSIEYRFYVNDGVRMTLERVELFSGLAIPAEAP
jgi:arabinofuranosyltransferase